MTIRITRNIRAGASALAIALGLAAAAQAQDRTYSIPAEPLASSLRQFARVSGEQIVFTDALVRGKTAPALQGAFSSDVALARLLAGTGLVARRSENGTLMIMRADGPQDLAADQGGSGVARVEDIVVTGSRIRGAPPSAPVITVTNEDMKNAGQSDLGEAIRSLTQNYNGGQNPGVAASQGGNPFNADLTGASFLNLRGMGADATLTLLNGNRLSYNGVNAAADISAIPAAAVSRIEILTDGASALYGSDAVAGVANVILRRDYDGVTASARYGDTTDGGGAQHQYNVVGGRTWTGGGVLAAYDYFKSEPIFAAQRAYTEAMPPESVLYAENMRHSAILSLTQQLTSAIKTSLDVTYKNGHKLSQNAFSVTTPLLLNGYVTSTDVEALTIAPRVELQLPGDWTSFVAATYGFDNAAITGTNYYAPSTPTVSTTDYDNRSRSLEVGGEGPLATVPGGRSRLALGAGYRTTGLDALTQSNSAIIQAFDDGLDNYFAYGEVFVPLVSPEMKLPFADNLSITGALRYENYTAIEDVVTPKVGISYRLSDIRLKASWGRSFHAPTFYQLYSNQTTLLRAVSGYGSTFPTGATYISVSGGNSDLKPERSENLTLTAEYSPPFLDGLDVSLSVFSVDYKDRITAPLTSYTGVLTNPLYADITIFSPTVTQIGSYVSNSAFGLQSLINAAYDPAKVVAIVDNRNRNVARENYRGVDASVRYRFLAEEDRSLTLSGSASYLESEQELKEGLSTVGLAGNVFRSPHLRARSGAVLQQGNLTLAAYASYIGGTTDRRRSTQLHVSSVTTLDLTGHLKIRDDVDFSFSALNVFNARPENVYTSSVLSAPYDTTNYSAIGRFLGVSITKSW
ncbi:TonB-dependent receptor [Brevundimonas sp. SORGH_AS_0993]|uniref:TonB-dependent receptor n=1 Tax=Brevundimonas sp. SORGH_AS_0993 TaxID=3041794 RepID=UPI0027818016|nr:TonB-dependent receptor [Brevundimonas sp. SORGH_AS_0993]MDQ1153426.1 iron complex outermembrane receptor protein [Brevundimonas sp. SORGH_AS_0993]